MFLVQSSNILRLFIFLHFLANYYNRELTNLYLGYHSFYTIEGRKALNANIAVTHIKNIGKMVAMLNGWVSNEQLSEINQRLVFHHVKSNAIFMAIDTEKGDFEIHSSDTNSNHLGAISFDGDKVESPKNHKLKFKK